jgi:hypothetical protein
MPGVSFGYVFPNFASPTFFFVSPLLLRDEYVARGLPACRRLLVRAGSGSIE